MDDPTKAHAARVYAADPLLSGQDELTAKRGEEWLETADAIGLAAVDRLHPDTLPACWSPLVVHRLRARAAGPDPEAALGALLDLWLAMPRGGRPGQALSVLWPSRDTAPVRALAVRGFAPITSLAVRGLAPVVSPSVGGLAPDASSAARHPRTHAAPDDDVVIRPARPGDVDVVTAMYERLVAYDAQWGWVTVRASTSERLRESVEREVLPLNWCWVAEAEGQPVGCVIVEPPGRSGWISHAVNEAPVTYLGVMYVEPSVRGRGVGAALTDAAHAAAASQGASTMLLHHALPNPLSTPFWARRGYRPLMTQWVRHLQ
ncbi:GNAT family N-acetyltransferase [Nonomuraea sp. PA05]|uniref:GNAT family N-acetyltransferase n=1 Tax=Nonomuraea sp. PA05 TaxID=2604466 RepID=UPI0011D416D9|nr:GNAT family N-acetyltransferase [Nonomuraea sp. PA05]TYB59744.1 GNAT family N-acetyltransferase [Nonomuraea sp. PA05]